MLFVLFFACTVMFCFTLPNPSWILSQLNLSKSVFEESLSLKQKKKQRVEKNEETLRTVPEYGFNSKQKKLDARAICNLWDQTRRRVKINLFSFQSHCCTPSTCHIYRCSSVPVSWVRWKSSVMSVWARSCPGCRPGLVVTCRVRASRNCRSSVWPSRSCSAICASICSSAPGHGTNCGRRSSLCSTSAALRTRLPWV